MRLLYGLALGAVAMRPQHRTWHRARLVPDDYEDGELLTPDGSGVEFKMRCEASPHVCDWALATFTSAAAYLGNAIAFEAPIRVMVNFYSFCDRDGDCDTKEPVVGLSRPTRFYPLVKDGVVRMYPQALMRQIYGEQGDAHPFDIVMAMNADSFPSQSTPLIEVLSHELIHGLGFVSSLVQSEAGVLPWPTSADARLARAEFALDEFLFDAMTGLPLTLVISQSNATDVGHYIEELATRHGAFKLRIGDLVIPLETSIKPFRIGSSVSHLDSATYANSRDVLMIYRINKGHTVREYIQAHSRWDTAPYGPHTLRVMQAIGYTLNPSPSIHTAYSYAPPPAAHALITTLLTLIISLS